jgi:two-component system, sensor histidine kinase and response regulator
MMNILVIEDDTNLRDVIIEWLTLEGYEAFGTGDGVEGINMAFRNLPDLIVCDITMPSLDGHGVLFDLRSNPATLDTPFIFLTARASHEDIRKGMELGADDYITKPFTRLELLQAIQARLERKALQAQHYQQQLGQWQEAFNHEREQRLLKSKLVAMFSHDFRNPLSVIMWSINILRNYPDRLDEPRRQKHLKRADASVRELFNMLDDMLVVSQIEAANFKFSPELLNVGEFLQQLVEGFQLIHSETHSLVFKNYCADSVMTDTRLLRQIAGNLISNAIKYSPHDGEVQVLLDNHEQHLHLIVQDQGIGIPEEDQALLFTTFQRASNVGKVHGTGLGLAIVKQAVDLHGGDISLESKMGLGTTVTVRIPIT